MNLEWTKLNKLKFKLLEATTNEKTIGDAIEEQLLLGMSTSYKTLKHMRRDLHNAQVSIKKLTKQIKKEKLREEQNSRRA